MGASLDFYDALAPLFDALLSLKMKVNMPAEQWDELANKQKRTDGRRNKDQEEGNLAATCAIRRCEQLDAKGLLIIEDIQPVPNKAAEGDAALIRFAERQVTAGRTVCLVTDDRELKVRSKQCLKRWSEAFKVVSGSSAVEKAEPDSTNSRRFKQHQ